MPIFNEWGRIPAFGKVGVLIGMELKEVLEGLLICPISHSELSFLTEDKLFDLKQGKPQPIHPQLSAVLNDPRLTGILTNVEGSIYYPIIDDIVFLLSRYAIRLDHNLQVEEQSDEKTKADVQSFYDNFGWKAQQGVYQDAKDSEDLRPVCDDYIQQCHHRVKACLPESGRFLLDIASGPIQYPAYLNYSANFQYRICADISITALIEAKKKLNHKGIYLLCDITQLPIQDNKIDAIVSLHTLYHVPAEQQAKGFAELYRVLKSGGKSVIVYSWGTRSLLMNMFMFPLKLASAIRRKLLNKKADLYFYTHSYRWFCKEIRTKYNTQLFSWRSVNVPFLKVFIHPYLGGRCVLKFFAWLEESFPSLMGRIGAYPLFVSVKK